MKASMIANRSARASRCLLSPKGLRIIARGSGAAATPGLGSGHRRINPEGVAPCDTTQRNPVGVWCMVGIADPG